MTLQAQSQGRRERLLPAYPPPHAIPLGLLANGPGEPGAHIEAPTAPAGPACELKPTGPIITAAGRMLDKPTGPRGELLPARPFGALLPAGPGVELLPAGPRGRLSRATVSLRPRLH